MMRRKLSFFALAVLAACIVLIFLGLYKDSNETTCRASECRFPSPHHRHPGCLR